MTSEAAARELSADMSAATFLDECATRLAERRGSLKGWQERTADVLGALAHERLGQAQQAGSEMLLPTQIVLPPSQVVQLLGVYSERGGSARNAGRSAAPAFTRLLADVGRRVVQERVYADICSRRNLPDAPKDAAVYERVVAQVRPLLRGLRAWNAAVRLDERAFGCERCAFAAESPLVLARHRQAPHVEYGRYLCACCPFVCRDQPVIRSHYACVHGEEALFEEAAARAPCPLCPAELATKGQLALHVRQCRRDAARSMHRLLAPDNSDVAVVNRWLWPRARDLHAEPVAAPPGIQVVQATATGGASQTDEKRPAGLYISVSMPSGQPLWQKCGAPPGSRMFSGPPPSQPLTSFRHNSSLTGENVQTFQQQQIAQEEPKSDGHVDFSPFLRLCEICDEPVGSAKGYLVHLQARHGLMRQKNYSDLPTLAPLSCTSCRLSSWSYLGLERHLLMQHSLVTEEMMARARKGQDAAKCQLCARVFTCNLLFHLVTDHSKRLRAANLAYSCKACSYKGENCLVVEKHIAECGAQTATEEQSEETDKQAVEEEGAKRKRARIKYTCTPCQMRFGEYSEVVDHWLHKHLARVLVPLCRVDQCPVHQLPAAMLHERAGIDLPSEEPLHKRLKLDKLASDDHL